VKSWLTRLTFTHWLLIAGSAFVLATLVFPGNRGTAWQSVSGLSFSPDGKWLAIGVYGGRFRPLRERWYFADVTHTVVLAASGGERPPTILGSDRYRDSDVLNMMPEVFIGPSVAFASGGELVSASFGGSFNVWKVPDGMLLRKLSMDRPHVRTLVALPRRNSVLAAFRRWMTLWDLTDNSPPTPLETGVNIQAIAATPDGQGVALGGLISPEIEFWNIATHKLVHRFAAFDDKNASIRAMAYSPTAKTLVVANEQEIRIIDAEKFAVADVLPERLVLALAVSPDGRLLTTGRYDGVTLWDLPARRKKALRWQVPPVESLQFSPDGRRLAAGSSDGTTRVWDVRTGELLWTWKLSLGNREELLERLKTGLLIALAVGLPLYVVRLLFLRLKRDRNSTRPDLEF